MSLLTDSHDSEVLANDFNLSGYLIKYSKKSSKPGKAAGTTGKPRWFVYSHSTCKLYYYKSNKDPAPLGEMDIAFASMSYDADDTGVFSIRFAPYN